MPVDLLANETWYGGHYEAAIVLGGHADTLSDLRLSSAIARIWANDKLTLFGDRSKDDLAGQSVEDLNFLMGWMKVAALGVVPVKTIVVRELSQRNGNDWLYVSVPLGGLSEVVPKVGGWPFGDTEKSEDWRGPLEKALADLTMDLCVKVPIRVAGIGFEISGNLDERALNGMIPKERSIGYVAHDGGKFTYFPTTRWNQK